MGPRGGKGTDRTMTTSSRQGRRSLQVEGVQFVLARLDGHAKGGGLLILVLAVQPIDLAPLAFGVEAYQLALGVRRRCQPDDGDDVLPRPGAVAGPLRVARQGE